MTSGVPTWRAFLRAMADEIDGLGGEDVRDALLRGVGRRMAASNPLPPAPDVAGVEQEINDLLATWGWGGARLTLDTEERALLITHHGLPRIGVAGDPPGTWLSALLEGLYETWLNALPGAQAGDLMVRRTEVAAESVMLRYGRVAAEELPPDEDVEVLELVED
jgi:hypothetical protein